jgi:hypothetical protein
MYRGEWLDRCPHAVQSRSTRSSWPARLRCQFVPRRTQCLIGSAQESDRPLFLRAFAARRPVVVRGQNSTQMRPALVFTDLLLIRSPRFAAHIRTAVESRFCRSDGRVRWNTWPPLRYVWASLSRTGGKSCRYQQFTAPDELPVAPAGTLAQSRIS